METDVSGGTNLDLFSTEIQSKQRDINSLHLITAIRCKECKS